MDKAVSDAGHIWNDTRRDFGIDGHIEFVDAATQVSGFAVAAQVKGTAVGFSGENRNQGGFRFTCEAEQACVHNSHPGRSRNQSSGKPPTPSHSQAGHPRTAPEEASVPVRA
jgi:hypothetical protein